MALYITSLNSGSNGNCYYIGNDDAAVLVDAGISCRETARRMARLGLSMDKVKAIFISHEHSDHISGIEQLSKKCSLPVYITSKTLQAGRLTIDPDLIAPFKPYEAVNINGLSIIAFPKYHDADDPHSFIVSFNGVNIGILTDIGYACENVTGYFKQCHAAFLESNYDEEMLKNGGYPFHLKRRISADTGHLSNTQALQLFLEHRPAFMSHLILSHLSKNNNTPEIVQALFDKHAGPTKIIVASRYTETPVYHITNQGSGISITTVTARRVKLRTAAGKKNELQLSLF